MKLRGLLTTYAYRLKLCGFLRSTAANPAGSGQIPSSLRRTQLAECEIVQTLNGVRILARE